MNINRTDIHEQPDGSMWVALPPCIDPLCPHPDGDPCHYVSIPGSPGMEFPVRVGDVVDVVDGSHDRPPTLAMERAGEVECSKCHRNFGQVRVVGVYPIISRHPFGGLSHADGYVLLLFDGTCQFWQIDGIVGGTPARLLPVVLGGVALRVEWVAG